MRWLLLLMVACGPASTVVRVPASPARLPVHERPAWPAEAALLHPQSVVVPARLAGRIVAIDAGHGAPGNTGARSARCRAEADVVEPVARMVAETLRQAGLEVVELRPPGERPTYTERLRRLQASGAELMISIHGDIRGEGRPWSPSEGCAGLRLDGERGFSVLWSDEDPARTPARERLARALGARLSAVGLPAYAGGDYVGLYDPTRGAPGVFVDRHLPRQRIRFLRRPTVPSVIVETHHLLDPDEEARWREPAVHRAFAQALLAGVVDVLADR